MLDTVFRILKITVIIAVCFTFMTAISALIQLVVTLTFASIIGEFFTLISMYLPFNASVVFGAIGVVLNAILSFLIAKKIFDLTSWSISSI